MKLLFVVLLLTVNLSAGEEVSPIGKSIELISSLQAKIISEGEQSQKIYEGFSEWCEETNKNTAYEIKTSKTEIADLTATISQETALIESLTTKVEELSSKIKVDEQDLKAATDIRAAEAADFAAEKHELDSIIDTLQRAIGILEKHAGSALLQERGAAALTKALSLMVQAAGFSSADESRLTALVQESEDSFDDDAGAPDAATYESHSGNIVDTLRRLLEKAEVQLRNAQNREQKALFEFQQLAQSIEDAIRYANKELSEAKKGINAAGEKKATAEGDLEVTKADLAEDTRALEDLRTDCMTKAEDFEAETKSRGEELGALAQAKKIISETTGGAGAQAYPKKEERRRHELSEVLRGSLGSALGPLTEAPRAAPGALRAPGGGGPAPIQEIRASLRQLVPRKRFPLLLTAGARSRERKKHANASKCRLPRRYGEIWKRWGEDKHQETIGKYGESFDCVLCVYLFVCVRGPLQGGVLRPGRQPLPALRGRAPRSRAGAQAARALAGAAGQQDGRGHGRRPGLGGGRLREGQGAHGHDRPPGGGGAGGRETQGLLRQGAELRGQEEGRQGCGDREARHVHRPDDLEVGPAAGGGGAPAKGAPGHSREPGRDG
ncbi:unnamed protein product [Prorocentrum cordatum]|uniref:Uncharacterized protein n=1 Tax=Prorocentrum cordatum TaxID=2364126 RepID=A0ABN9Q1R5_9DINO|nr:unnamed protein product [Polarella glacialis]